MLITLVAWWLNVAFWLYPGRDGGRSATSALPPKAGTGLGWARAAPFDPPSPTVGKTPPALARALAEVHADELMPREPLDLVYSLKTLADDPEA